MKKIINLSLCFLMIFTLCSCNIQISNQTMPELIIGEQIVFNDLAELTLNSVLIFDEVEELMNLKSEENTQYLCFVWNIKALSTEVKQPNELIGLTVTYQDKYKYDITDFYKENSAGTDLPPLQNERIYAVVKIPNEIAEGRKNLNTIVELCGTKYTFSGSGVEDATEFLEAARKDLQYLVDLLNNFSDKISYDWRKGLIFSTEEVFSEIASFSSEEATKTTKMLEELSTIQPPKCYQEGYEAILSYISSFDTLLKELSNSNGLTKEKFIEIMEEMLEIETPEAINTMRPF